MTRTYDVYGVGHALVDIQYQVAPEFLAAYQIEKGVMTLVDEARQRTLTAALNREPIPRLRAAQRPIPSSASPAMAAEPITPA